MTSDLAASVKLMSTPCGVLLYLSQAANEEQILEALKFRLSLETYYRAQVYIFCGIDSIIVPGVPVEQGL